MKAHIPPMQPPSSPVAPDGDAVTQAMQLQQLQTGSHFENVIITPSKAASETNLPIADLRFEQVVFREVDFRNTKWKGCTCLDARFERCDISNATWSNLDLQRVELVDCRLTGWVTTESHWQNVLMQRCQMDISSALLTSFRSVRIEASNLQSIDWSDAVLENVYFDHCNLQDARFVGGRFNQPVDVRGSELRNVQFDRSQLSKLIIDPTQAVDIALAAGVTIQSGSE